MKSSEILLTAFQDTSAEQLVKGVKGCQPLLLPSDKIKDSVLLISAIDASKVSYIFAFGQKPNIKDKVYIERTAREGEKTFQTGGDPERMKLLLESYGIAAQLSDNAGTSYCNRLYWNGLRHIKTQGIAAEMIFLHIPFLRNISDIDSFRKGIFAALEDYMTGQF